MSVARRSTQALAVALAVVFAARAVRADGTPTTPPPAPSSGTPTTGTPTTGTPTTPPPVVEVRPAAPPPAPGMVHLRLRAYRPRDVARLYVEQGPDRWALKCTSPCAVDLPPGALLRVTLNDEYDEPHDFSLQTEAGRDVELEVKPASKGAVAGGIVMVSLGGLTAIVGLVLFAIGGSSTTTSSDRGGLRTAGGVCLALGGGLTVGGILLMANRSHEPRVKQENFDHDPSADRPTRAAFLDDAARPSPPLPAVIGTPLGFDVTF